MAKANITAEQAAKYLGEAAPENEFWLYGGGQLRRLKDLAAALPKLSKEGFEHHVNKEKNDFALWVEGSLGDAQLSGALKGVKTKAALLKKIKERIALLTKAAKKA